MKNRPLYIDVKLEKGLWYTLKALNFFEAEEFRDRLEDIRDLGAINNQEKVESYNLHMTKICELFSIDFLNLSESDSIYLFFDPGILTQWVLSNADEDSKEKKVSEVKKNFFAMPPGMEKEFESKLPKGKNTPAVTISEAIVSVWNVCDSISDALVLLNNLPYSVAMDCVKLRAKALEEAYSTSDDRIKKEQKRLIDEIKQRNPQTPHFG